MSLTALLLSSLLFVIPRTSRHVPVLGPLHLCSLCPCCHLESCSPRYWRNLLPHLLTSFLKRCLPGESFLTTLFKLHSTSHPPQPTPLPDLNFSIVLITIQYKYVLCIYMACLFILFIFDPPPPCLFYKKLQHTEQCLAWEGMHRIYDDSSSRAQAPGTHSKVKMILTNCCTLEI